MIENSCIKQHNFLSTTTKNCDRRDSQQQTKPNNNPRFIPKRLKTFLFCTSAESMRDTRREKIHSLSVPSTHTLIVHIFLC